ncbi:hypothetical protein BpHYR1_046201 [Brachionus plicatilis]|uniref:Uncharacterized protein n=1 Tax=Brachionus plicatilis TaxID=10195 RepID=A0A3M7Q2X7_BRAPC|nr:hypothetical protein BpHYR1_046201 [Brachionus plicatilis]
MKLFQNTKQVHKHQNREDLSLNNDTVHSRFYFRVLKFNINFNFKTKISPKNLQVDAFYWDVLTKKII